MSGVKVNDQTIECEYVVLATGMWSRQIGEDMDISIPLYPAEHFYVITEPIKNLPKETLTYCAHEYTLDNIGFAKLLDPNNHDLIAREEEVKKILKEGGYSVPSVLENELKINPFLRCREANVINAAQNYSSKQLNEASEVLGEIRNWKDNF